MMCSPVANTRLTAQPAITSRCSADSARSAGASARSSSIVRIAIGRPDRGDLLGDVDGHGAPGDAPPAADAAGGAELVDPRRELVRHPLPVARLRGAAHASAVDVRMPEREARVPD